MKNRIHVKLLPSLLIGSLASASLPALCADDSHGVTITGHWDAYTMLDTGSPGTVAGTNLRQFDLQPNQFNLAALEIDLVKRPTVANPFGITASLLFGRNADIIASNLPASAGSMRYLQQLFVTYAVPHSDATVDLGRYLTWVGYEGVDSTADDNYSRSFLFTLGQPISHVGLRATAPISKAITGSAYLVNGWNDVQDSNGGQSFGATLGLTPDSKSVVTLNYFSGQEGSATANGSGFTTPGSRSVNLGDLVASYQLTPKFKVAANADYANARGLDGVSGGSWSGLDLYVVYQIADKWSLAARAETFNDPDGLRGTGNPARYNSATGTIGYNLSKDSQIRLEFRYDACNVSAFNADNGTMADHRTTFTFAHSLKF